MKNSACHGGGVSCQTVSLTACSTAQGTLPSGNSQSTSHDSCYSQYSTNYSPSILLRCKYCISCDVCSNAARSPFKPTKLWHFCSTLNDSCNEHCRLSHISGPYACRFCDCRIKGILLNLPIASSVRCLGSNLSNYHLQFAKSNFLFVDVSQDKSRTTDSKNESQ